MKKNNHLPLLGVGPLYVITITVVTLGMLFLHGQEVIPTVALSPELLLVIRILAVLLVALGVVIWMSAVFWSKVTHKIKENQLVTDGIYGVVRHPIYSAFMLVEWGILLYTGNVIFILLILLYWLYLTVLMKHTEEKWLLEFYGDEYRDYCRRVNRCIPWFRKIDKK